MMTSVHHPFAHLTPRKGAMRERPSGGMSRKPSRCKLFMAAMLGIAFVVWSFRATSCHRWTPEELALAMEAQPGSTGNYAFATAYRISAARLAVFVQSWGTHSPGTKLVILTHNELLDDPLVQQLYSDYQVEALPFEPPPELDDPDDEEDFRKPGRAIATAMEQMLHYVMNSPNPIHGIALCLPAGDVALQGDPFMHSMVLHALAKNLVLLTSEGGSALGPVAMGDHAPSNRTLNDCFGSQLLAKVGPSPLLSSDVIFGRREPMRQYLRLMVDVLMTRVRHRCMRNSRPDVAALHYAIYDLGADPRLLDFAFSVRNTHASPLLPIALALPARFDVKGRVRRTTTTSAPPPVLTQYSSHPVLVKLLLGRWRYMPGETLGFAQRSGYIGSRMEGLEKLPTSWEKAARMEQRAMSEAGSTERLTIDTIVGRVQAAAGKQRRHRLALSGSEGTTQRRKTVEELQEDLHLEVEAHDEPDDVALAAGKGKGKPPPAAAPAELAAGPAELEPAPQPELARSKDNAQGKSKGKGKAKEGGTASR